MGSWSCQVKEGNKSFISIGGRGVGISQNYLRPRLERKGTMTKDRTLSCTVLSMGESTSYGHSFSTLAGAGDIKEKTGYLKSRRILQPILPASPGASHRFQATHYPHPPHTTEPSGVCGHSLRDMIGSGKCLLEERSTEEVEPRASPGQPALCELLFFSTSPTFSNFTTKHNPLYNNMFMFERLKANHPFFSS